LNRWTFRRAWRSPPPGSHNASMAAIVPLSRQAVAILWLAHAITGKVFSCSRDEPISDMTLNRRLKALGYDTSGEHIAHGFRTTFSTLLNGKCDPDGSKTWDGDLIELQLAHPDDGSVKAIYNRTGAMSDRCTGQDDAALGRPHRHHARRQRRQKGSRSASEPRRHHRNTSSKTPRIGAPACSIGISSRFRRSARFRPSSPITQGGTVPRATALQSVAGTILKAAVCFVGPLETLRGLHGPAPRRLQYPRAGPRPARKAPVCYVHFCTFRRNQNLPPSIRSM
jgi:hypothetical protein